MKKPKFAPSQIEHVEGMVAEVERHRARPFSEADLQRLLADIESPDELTRMRAVRDICPCRMPWEVFDRLRRAAKGLQKDPSPLVRANARHVEEDARHVASVESLSERYQEYQEVEEERQAEEARRFRRGGKGRR
jgi:hypothetical protein